MADIWINPTRADRAGGAEAGEWGLSLRFYDKALGAWRSTWHGPKKGWVIPFVARPDAAADNAGGIVLEGTREDVALRWTFSAIEPNSFQWRAEETGPDGVAFVRQRFEATRIP